MITKEKATDIFKKQYGNLKIMNACTYYSKKYKKTFYVFTATENGDIDPNDPHYAVDSDSGAILNFDITSDLDGFFNAVAEKSFIKNF